MAVYADGSQIKGYKRGRSRSRSGSGTRIAMDVSLLQEAPAPTKTQFNIKSFEEIKVDENYIE